MLAQVPAPNKITNPALGNNLQNLTGAEFFEKFVPMLISLVLIIGVVIFTFVLVLGAISWISSGGDKAQVESARGKVTTAIIGLVLLFSAWAIINLIELFFGINILTLDILNLAIQ
ncbi:hypothetical protein A2V56_01030 [Candidatus Woesebacteria bacterium RBG_19FT_COMBO_42_9]|uniref:Uncharacterized protein n=1 Tax=Candidatus Woesebacteria bacterium RBG_16_42_24 TaxID=1802485 RepID=A0A1F7XLC9_9BACT|nr:MAG: hypothetical protein A2V97_03455 [Candidatus Woesebacteria bacterium RBG_16_42_24]OGM17895.1 MAG: hypothetical protein A2V56_01030 [Candidatus Woesebacteria bacterium RBG_19FT_COMBO_42_9]OGM68415.1 MAG: hypothetical protein A2985_01250 [Candidatus Woesebacteria bacterium RIFCSPLOWO2_01_FULL_43_11]